MIIDITGIELTPGNMGNDCKGNGEWGECCCDECNYALCCVKENWQELCEECDEQECPRKG